MALIMFIFEVQGWVTLVVTLALLAIKIFAFASSLLYPAEAYLAADKLTKPTWSIILGVAIAVHVLLLNVLLLNLVLTIAALVFLVDVRPALAGLRRR